MISRCWRFTFTRTMRRTHFPIHYRLLDIIASNQVLPSDSFCNLPEVNAFLDRGAPLSYTACNMPSQWLVNGKITFALRGCKWNHPVLVVSMKNATLKYLNSIRFNPSDRCENFLCRMTPRITAALLKGEHHARFPRMIMKARTPARALQTYLKCGARVARLVELKSRRRRPSPWP